MSRKVRRILLIVGGLALLGALTLGGLWLAVRHEPAFYREAMALDRTVLEKGSDRMLQQATALAGAVKKEGHWKALFTAEQINGWLAVDRVKNHPRSLPPALSDPRVAIDSKQVAIACRWDGGWGSSVLSLTVEPSVPEPNVIALRIVKARAGLLPMPLGHMLDRITQSARDMQMHLEWRHADGDPVALLSLSSGRHDQPIHIETLRLADGEIYVAGKTQTKKP